jgi:hypothetical protein
MICIYFYFKKKNLKFISFLKLFILIVKNRRFLGIGMFVFGAVVGSVGGGIFGLIRSTEFTLRKYKLKEFL